MRVPELHALERFSSLWVGRRPMRNSRVCFKMELQIEEE